MRLDEEIMYGKKEKEFNKNVDDLKNQLKEAIEITNETLEGSAVPMVKILKLQHSEPAEIIREADYPNALKKILDEGFTADEKYFYSKILGEEIKNDTKSERFKSVSMIREYIETNLAKLDSNNLETIMEGYNNMAEVYVFCEGTRENKIRYC